MVATLERHKDHATLLRAVPAITARMPDFELWLVGEGSLRGELESLIRELNIVASVRLLGRRTDVGELLGQADVFVLSTTRQEGLGSVLIEALAAGLPVVASDVPACREMLAGGRWGRLIPPGDSQALAEAIHSALMSPTSHEDRQIAAAYAQEFSPRTMMSSYLRLAEPALVGDGQRVAAAKTMGPPA
jgi:glycosyltransferase involved in cell wall biosynthesis